MTESHKPLEMFPQKTCRVCSDASKLAESAMTQVTMSTQTHKVKGCCPSNAATTHRHRVASSD